MAKVLLVNPLDSYKLSAIGPSEVTVPCGLMHLAAGVAPYCDLEVIDLNIVGEDKLSTLLCDFRPDVVGITGWISGFSGSERAGRIVKETLPSAKIIFGGPYASVAPKIYIDNCHADAVVVGHGIGPLREIIKRLDEDRDFLKGLTNLYYRGRHELNLEPHKSRIDYEVPPHKFFPASNYISKGLFPGRRTALALTSWGCPCRCSFCKSDYTGFRRYLCRSGLCIEREVNHLIHEVGANAIYFVDSSLTLREEHISKVLYLLKDSGAVWAAQSRANEITAVLAKNMYLAGCRWTWFGLETLNGDLLAMNEKQITPEISKRAIRRLKYVGISPFAFVLFGLPNQSYKDIQDVLSLLAEENIYAIPNVLMPIPGTPLWDLAKERMLVSDPADLARTVSDQYYQGSRVKASANLSNVSDEDIESAVKWIWQHNQEVGK